MKKLFATLAVFIMTGVCLVANAATTTPEQVLAFFNKYKNYYTERKITKQGGDFKITCLRQPSTSDYKIPAHFVIGLDANGNLKIKEEMMYTKQQKFLKYADKK